MSNLPAPSETRPPSEVDPWDLWRDVVNLVKKRIMQPSFWQALETVLPITIENNTLVVGLPSAAGHYSGHLNGSENRQRLEQIIKEVLGYPLTLRIIDGSDETDWERVKKRDQAAADAQQAFRARQENPQAGRAQTWDILQERLYAMYSRAQGHHLPQGRVQYLLQVIPLLAEGCAKLQAAAPHEADKNERALARILDKVGGLVEMPSALVALELYRYQQMLKRKQEG